MMAATEEMPTEAPRESTDDGHGQMPIEAPRESTDDGHGQMPIEPQLDADGHG